MDGSVADTTCYTQAVDRQQVKPIDEFHETARITANHTHKRCWWSGALSTALDCSVVLFSNTRNAFAVRFNILIIVDPFVVAVRRFSFFRSGLVTCRFSVLHS